MNTDDDVRQTKDSTNDMSEDTEETVGERRPVEDLDDKELLDEFESLARFRHDEQRVGQVTPHILERFQKARELIIERMGTDDT